MRPVFGEYGAAVAKTEESTFKKGSRLLMQLALGATFGVIAGDQVLMWAAVAGVATLLVTYPAAFRAVQWAGAAYLAWLGGNGLVPVEFQEVKA